MYSCSCPFSGACFQIFHDSARKDINVLLCGQASSGAVNQRFDHPRSLPSDDVPGELSSRPVHGTIPPLQSPD